MIQTILAAHGKLAPEMKASAEMIFGNLPDIQTVEFLKEEGLESIQEKIKTAINQEGRPVLILTDLFCGTPYNASCAVALNQTAQEIDIISGMSLPLILEAATMCPNQTLTAIVKHLTSIPQQTVKAFSQIEIEEEEEL